VALSRVPQTAGSAWPCVQSLRPFGIYPARPICSPGPELLLDLEHHGAVGAREPCVCSLYLIPGLSRRTTEGRRDLKRSTRPIFEAELDFWNRRQRHWPAEHTYSVSQVV